MAKTKRGKWAKKEPLWRHICPICQRKRVKVLWEITKGTEKLKICKSCYASIEK